MGGGSFEPAEHYDRVTEAWSLLLGEELHYGVFETPSDPLPEATARLTALMTGAAGVEAGNEVLDVGCGTGAPACELARRGARVTGISTSRVGVEAARARAEATGLEGNATFELRDGMNNGFADRSFDRVWALESSHLMRHRDRFVAECARVLRPGGRLAVCDIVLRRPLGFAEVRRLREPLGLLREVFGDAHMEPVTTYEELMSASGLTVGPSRDLTEETRPTFARWRENAERHREAVVDAIGENAWQQFVDSCRVLDGFWDDGTLGYALMAAARN